MSKARLKDGTKSIKHTIQSNQIKPFSILTNQKQQQNKYNQFQPPPPPQQNSNYQESPRYQQHPRYNQEPPRYQQQQQPSYQQHQSRYQQQPNYQQQPRYQQQPNYNQHPNYRQHPSSYPNQPYQFQGPHHQFPPHPAHPAYQPYNPNQPFQAQETQAGTRSQPPSSPTASTSKPSIRTHDARTSSRKKDEEKKLRRAGILPAFIKPKPKAGMITISKAAQEKKAKKALEALNNKHKAENGKGKKKNELAIGSVMTVSQLAHLTHQKLSRLQSLMQSAGLTDIRPDRILTSDDSAYLALESGYEPIINDSLAFDIYPDPPPKDPSILPLRPPIVCIMGHVDHGKTTLLDSLRSSSIADHEAGGITQHIGAFEVAVSDLIGLKKEKVKEQAQDHPSPQTITFLDTPGHAAFSAMRSRGALTTDVAIIVVAADDGVKPQTLEVIELVKQTDIGIIVAITKCDKPSIDLHRTKSMIYEAGIEIEDLGGEIPCVEVSALNKKGLDQLAETIIAVAEVRELRTEVEGVRFEGRVIESDVGRERGNVATIIGLRGTLKIGTDLIAGTSYGRARQLISVSGEPIDFLKPGQPALVTGWKQLPEAGSLVLGVETEDQAKRAYENRIRREESRKLMEEIEVVNEKRATAKEIFENKKSELVGLDRRARWAHLREREKLEMVAEAKAKGEEESESEHELRIITKADFTGTVEALKTALGGLGNETVRVKIVSSGVGNVTESDVGMAVASKGMIVGFNVGVDRAAFIPMGTHKIECKTETVIYRLVEHVTNKLIEMLPKRFEERVVGEATIAEIFEITVKGRITKKVAGCKVMNGEIKKKDGIRIMRGMEIIWEGNLEQLKHGKKEEKSISKGKECGIEFGNGFNEFMIGDKVLGVEKFEVARSLSDGL